MSGASNQDKTIATRGSHHIAQSGPPDVCLLPDKKTPIAPINQVPTTRATEHTTAKTVIASQPIVQKGDAVGPPSDPAHAGTAGGIKSSTYRKEARATSASPNVKTEGGQPARHTDTTTQNHGNTTGAVRDASLSPDAASQPRKPEERCTIVEMTLVCSHGRTTTPKDPVLDVLKGDTVTATATRKNLLLPGEPSAACPPAFKDRHPKTKFTITRVGTVPADNKGPEPFDGIDVKKLGAEWLGTAEPPFTFTPGSGALNASTPVPARDRQSSLTYSDPRLGGNGATVGGREVKGPLPDARDTRTGAVTQGFTPPPPVTTRQDAVVRHVNQNGPNMQPGSGANLLDAAARRDQKETMEARNTAQQAHAADQRTAKAKAFIATVRGAMNGAQTVKNMGELIDSVKAQPKFITINGQGCAGSVTRKLAVFPDKVAICDPMKFKEVLAAFQTVTMLFQAGQQFCDAIGFGGYKFKILDPCSAEIMHAWKELEKDSTKNVRMTKQRVNREFSFALGCSLLDFTAEGRIPVIQFIGGIPGATTLANKLRDWFNIAFDIVIIVKLGIALKLTYARDRYEEHSIGFDFNPSVEVSAGISLKASKAGVTLTVGVSIRPVLSARPHPTDYAQLVVHPGDVEFFVNGALQYDFLGLKDEIKGRYTFGKIGYPGTTLSLASWIGG